jgi:hypothetical protein
MLDVVVFANQLMIRHLEVEKITVDYLVLGVHVFPALKLMRHEQSVQDVVLGVPTVFSSLDMEVVPALAKNTIAPRYGSGFTGWIGLVIVYTSTTESLFARHQFLAICMFISASNFLSEETFVVVIPFVARGDLKRLDSFGQSVYLTHFSQGAKTMRAAQIPDLIVIKFS